MSDIFPISFMPDSSNLVTDQLSGATWKLHFVLLCLARNTLCIRSIVRCRNYSTMYINLLGYHITILLGFSACLFLGCYHRSQAKPCDQFKSSRGLLLPSIMRRRWHHTAAHAALLPPYKIQSHLTKKLNKRIDYRGRNCVWCATSCHRQSPDGNAETAVFLQ
jgi:hypothetical protein